MSDDTSTTQVGLASLDEEDAARLITELLGFHDGGLTREQIYEALDAFDASYTDMLISCATWRLWRNHEIRFDYIDGEIVVAAS